MLRALCCVCLAAVLFAMWPAARAATPPESFSTLIDQVLPAVVNVSAVRSANSNEVASGGSHSLGSGFVIDRTGYVVTNAHVIADAHEIFVSFADGRRRAAVLAGKDEKTDIALLRVQGVSGLQFTGFANSDQAKVGDWVIAIGSPFGLGASASAGIISARNRQLDAELYDDFIQTDAAINRGNSGGPLFDLQGRVVGVNSALMSPSGGSVGVGFAIPANTVATIVAQLKKSGRVRRGWIGANVQDLTPDLAQGFKLASARGALIGHVTPGGPAALAGLLPGDIVLKADDKDVENSRVMQRFIVESDIGRQLNLSLVRQGKMLALTVRVARRQETAATAPPVPPRRVLAPSATLFGLELSSLSSSERVKNGIGPALGGVFVKSVFAGSPAAECGILPGDIVMELDQANVIDAANLTALLRQRAQSSQAVALFTLNRRGEPVFKALRLRQDKIDGPLRTAKK